MYQSYIASDQSVESVAITGEDPPDQHSILSRHIHSRCLNGPRPNLLPTVSGYTLYMTLQKAERLENFIPFIQKAR